LDMVGGGFDDRRIMSVAIADGSRSWSISRTLRSSSVQKTINRNLDRWKLFAAHESATIPMAIAQVMDLSMGWKPTPISGGIRNMATRTSIPSAEAKPKEGAPSQQQRRQILIPNDEAQVLELESGGSPVMAEKHAVTWMTRFKRNAKLMTLSETGNQGERQATSTAMDISQETPQCDESISTSHVLE